MLIIHSPDNIFTILVSIFKSKTLVVLGLLKYCKSSEILQVSHFRRHDLFLQFYLSCIFLLFSCSFGDKAAMAQSMPFIVLAATLLLSTFSRCSAENVYCVRPTLAPNTSCSSCPHSDIPCATLSEYAQDAKQYFTSNTTMMFLPGNHTLDVNFTVANISRFTLCGQSSLSLVTTVVCSGEVGFNIMSIFDFQIHSVSFTSCGRNFGSPEVSKYALLLEFIEFAELVNASFHDVEDEQEALAYFFPAASQTRHYDQQDRRP